MAIIQEERAALLEKTLDALTDEILVKEWATDASIVAEGQALYMKQCFACHGTDLDAPNKLGLSLVDGEWKYGSKPKEIFKLINEGSPEGSTGMAPTGAKMVPWGGTYNPKQIAQLVAFIISKNPKDFANY